MSKENASPVAKKERGGGIAGKLKISVEREERQEERGTGAKWI